MKRSLLALALALGSLLLTPPALDAGRTRADGQGRQGEARQAESTGQARQAQKPVYDINGKRLRAGEQYVAQRTLPSGRVIAYRKNKREVAALVKALKADGVTDEKLLNPDTWLMTLCSQVPDGQCINGGCDNSYCARTRADQSTQKVKSTQISFLYYCACKSLPQ